MKDKRKTAVNTLVCTIAVGLIVAAIWDQLRRPPAERTWNGVVLHIPYDFRMPTLDRVRTAFWNKDDAHIVVPHAPIGMGWSINFYPLLHAQTAHSSTNGNSPTE